MSKKVKRKVHSLTNSSYENDYSPPNDQRFGRGSGRRRNSANLCGAERFEGRRHDNTETGRSEKQISQAAVQGATAAMAGTGE